MAVHTGGWDEAVPVVARLLGTDRLGEPVDLGGSGRSHVWRVTAAGTSYVVKVDLSDDGTAYAREVSSLHALGGRSVAPELVGADDAARLLVMEDLGGGGNLADAILGDARPRAVAALEQWVDVVSALHRASVPAVLDTFAAQLSARAPDAPLETMDEALALGMERLAEELPPLGIDPAPGIEALHDLPSGLSSRRVLSPSDACPDNHVVRGGVMRLVDFEGAEVRHPAWDVAYLRVPWPTCWCAWAVPEDVADAAVARYAATVDDWPTFEHDVELATLGWSVMTAGWFLPRALRPEPGDGDGSRVPSRRRMVQHRLRHASTLVGPAVLTGLAGSLHEALAQRWGPNALPLGPAWRSSPR